MKRTKSRAVQAQQGAATILQPQQAQALIVPSAGSDGYGGGYDGYQEGSPAEDEDPMVHPPLWQFLLGGFEIFWGACTNVFQVITSITGIVGWQQHEMIDAYGYQRAAQIILSRNLGLFLVATVLGVGAQVAIQAFTQQIRKTWKQKRVIEHESTRQALIEVVSDLNFGQVLGYAGFLICAFSDYLFVTQIDSTGSLGSYILMSFWALILAGSSTHVLHDGIQRVYSGVLALRAWRLWQDALRAHFAELARQYQQ